MSIINGITSGTGAVDSAAIADGSIVNADVNASAAIAGTKISPNFGSQNISTTGTITAPGIINTIMYVVGTDATTDSTRALPADGYVYEVMVRIVTSYSVGATMSVGQTGSTSLFAGVTDILATGSAGDIYKIEQITAAASANPVRVTVGGSPAVGSAIVCIKYSSPSA